MDYTTEMIDSYATTLKYSDLTPEAIHSTKRSFIDAFGCAIGGSSEEVSNIAKRLAGNVSSKSPARIWGTSEYSSPDMAAFANTVMVHCLNFDECWRNLPGFGFYVAGGFPGRTIPPILAMAETLGADGRAVITATVVAYDVCYRFVPIDIHRIGWNQSFCTGMASAAGMASLMGLTQDQTANALSLTAISALRLRQTRAGKMPMWKSCDCADANRDVVHYVQLAREGMIAPGEPFEGKWGLWHQSGIEGIELEPFAPNNGSFKITQMSHKIFPCHNHGIGPISMALELRKKLKIDEIEAVNLQCYAVALLTLDAGADKPEKVDPQTREDADHSLPWLVAVALQDGAVTRASFRPERVRDPELRALMHKVHLVENPEFTREFPQNYHTAMEIVTRSGERHTASVLSPKGYVQNPLTDRELEDKFFGLTQEVLDPAQGRKALDLLWRLEELESFTPVFDALCTQ